MNFKHIFFLIVTTTSFVIKISVNAQITNLNWKVGRNSSFNFNSGIAQINLSDSNKSLMSYTNTSISDRNGNIIFYSNACRVYDKNGNVMPNGSGFNQGTYSNNYVNTDYYPPYKAATIVPFPNDSNKFYMFYLNMEFNVDGDYVADKLYYLVVDRTLNNGLGDIVLKDQIAIGGDTLNKSVVFASKHGNGNDWWIIVRKHKGNKYYKVLVDSLGVHSPTSQIIGNSFPYSYSTSGSDNISLQGDRLAYTYISLSYRPFQFELLDFDRCNGQLSNYKTIYHPNTIDTIKWWSACFSPSGRYLYLNDKVKIYQMDLSSSNLLNSVQIVGLNTVLYRAFFKMEIAPDGKIYVSPYGSYEYMSVINKPDSFGLACNFVENAVQFGSHVTGPWADGGLPNVPNFALGKLDCGVGIENTNSIESGFSVYPNPTNSLLFITDKQKIKSISIHNLLGELMYSKIVNDEVESIDIRAFSKGMYFLQITDNKGNMSIKKIIKE